MESDRDDVMAKRRKKQFTRRLAYKNSSISKKPKNSHCKARCQHITRTTTKSTLLGTSYFYMEDSSGDEREILPKVRKKSFVSRGPITMSELALVRNSGQKLPIQFNEHGQPIGATSKKIQSYIGVCVRQQIPIIYNSWKEVSNELKDKIYDCISKITHDVFYRSTLWKEARKGRNNDYFDDATQDCASRIDELVATHKNEDILIDVLGPKEHGGRVRSVGGFVSQSQYFNTVKGKEKMITPQVEICHKEEDDSRCKSDKKRSNHSRSSIGSINIDLDTDELLVNTPNNKGVENLGCGRSIQPERMSCTLQIIHTYVVNNMKDVDMIHIPMNELIFRTHEDLLHYCGMVEIDYMCILAYITFHWMLHVIDLRQKCVYVLDSLRSKVNEDIHGVINVERLEDMTSETRSTTLSINSKMETCKGNGWAVL
uniref:Ubiquitin-like protease family profile domain-containing protein n=1 Tax=Cucumis melo TaxID=3656 RepID=A0A9I9EGZ3_CUCME